MRGDKFISNELKIKKISINDIKMYENNLSDEAVKYVNSIKKFGFKVTVFVLIAGKNLLGKRRKNYEIDHKGSHEI